ncbi:MAG: MliC family protein [Bacteroidota bacterium]
MLRTLTLFTAFALVGCADDTEAPEASGEPAAEAATPEAAPNAAHSAMTLDGPTTYTCVDGSAFTVSPSPDGTTADVELPDRKLSLERMDSSAGLRYGDGTVVVWVADGGAFVVENEEAILEDCTAATDA